MIPALVLALERLHRDAESKAARAEIKPGAYRLDALVAVTGTLFVRADAPPVVATSKARAWDLLLDAHGDDSALAAEMRAALEATAEPQAKRGAVSWDGVVDIVSEGSARLRAV